MARFDLSPKTISEFAAPILILLASLIHFLTYHQYAFLRIETLRVLITATLIGSAFALLSRVSHPIVKLLLLAGLTTFFLDIQLDIQTPVSLGVILLCVLTGTWILRERAAEILTYMSLIFIMATLLFPNTSAVINVESDFASVSYDNRLPPILHIIVDEHIGVEGIPTDIKTGKALKSELVNFYVSNDFLVHGKAFAQYQNTHNSIPNILNFQSGDIDRKFFENIEGPYSLKKNAYLEILSTRGYRVKVYQSDWLSYCGAPAVSFDSCVTYAGNSIKSIENVDVPASQKANFILNSLLNTSYGFASVRRVYNGRRHRIPLLGQYLPDWREGIAIVGPLPVMPIFSQLQEDIVGDSQGTVFFAHLNIPHYPYVLDRDCTPISDTDEWLYRYRQESVTPRDNDDKTRADRYVRYFEQMRCLQKKLGNLVDAIRDTGGYDEWTIVIHGDHGSRITLSDVRMANEYRLTGADFIDAFSTIFAVKAPGIEPGYDNHPASISDLLGIELFGDGYDASEDEHVFLFGKPKEDLTRKPMQWYE